ncbi:MAG TPA: ATP-binding protein [Bryobacteraceae bacterium]|nr:ATP-binding protein [Bryobacteraceae bacterium]
MGNERGAATGPAGTAISMPESRKTVPHITEATLDAIVRASPIAIVTLDLAGRVMTWNPAAEQIHGWTAEEVIGRPLPVVPEEMRADVQEIQAKILREGGVANLEHPCLRKDGSSVLASISGAPLHNDQGEPIGAVYMVSDITERKRAEKELQSAKEQAEAASRAKSQFLANMSHEIRTPMNGVLGMTELTLTTDLTDEQRDYLECVRSSAESLMKILNDILDYSKIEAGKVTLTAGEFNVRGVLADTLKPLIVRACQKGLRMAFHVEAAVPETVSGDSTRLRQVLVNLIDNSIKFTPTGEVFVLVKLLSRQAGKVHLSFSVRDTGIGIPKDKQGEIFESFTQADGSITRRFGGTGLGLSISSQLAEIMGGSIELNSEPGKGSTFSLRVPFDLPLLLTR